ncbi:hypothetical protein RhiirC2_769636 [Rhizophagus irregularis]|uniref:DUF8211 domain-containing protein n=1 Tax=Rhizophagus irregularis TaxID=588596 RepID=A0A2N1NYL4_9GLOM|nr:hypothetical protein RhiirC2_769636 [Rhizophagus irregularis]
MYRKRFDNLRIQHTTDNKTSKRQKLRFERACRSVFNNRGARRDSHVSADNIENQLHRARQHRFLFLPSQHIYKPLQHLKYYKNSRPTDFRYYNFPTLIKMIIPDKKKKKKKKLNNYLPPLYKPIPSDDRNTWHEKLGILIPNDLLPYVTEDPIYVSKNQEKLKGKHHAPGSKVWFTAIKERKRSAERIVEYANYITETTARAKLWGTSFNSIEHREEKLDKGKSDSISNKTKLDQPEQEFAQFKIEKSISKSTTQLERLEQDFAQFKIDYFSVMNSSADHYRYKGHTSDDTKELELRPRKCPDYMSLDNNRQIGSVKNFDQIH